MAVRAGGIPDILQKDGTTGFLYESGDIERAAALVQRLVEDAELRWVGCGLWDGWISGLGTWAW